MSWNRNSKLLAAACALALAGAARAESLIVRSSGPSAAQYAPGKSLPDTAHVVLRAGDQLTLLDGRGTRTLNGPGSFALGAAVQTASNDSRLAAFLGRGSQQRVRIGAVRGLNTAPPHAPNIWNVDTSRGGTVCVADPAAVALWRPDMTKDATLTIDGPAGHATVSWIVGQAIAPWPASLPVSSGASYNFAWSGGGSATGIRVKVLGAGGGGIEETASDLVRNGCSAQVDLLVNLMAMPAT